MNPHDNESSNPPHEKENAPVSVPASQAIPDSAPKIAAPAPVENLPSPHTDTLGPFVAGTDERCLWADPSTDEPRLKAGAVLLGDVIAHYVKGFNILIDKSGFEEGKLKGGGYTMTPDEKGAWMFVPDDEDGEKKVELKRSRDQSGDYYVVPCNSLVYIKLKQELRLPFYIIGRHNLKIRYVYQGLLLGTGPQVDPGFQGNLFIPLHNFTTSDVRVYINGKHSSFVSIDFVRTTPFFRQSEVPSQIRTVDELRRHFDSLQERPRILIEEEKVKERRTLEDYLQGAKPRSQMAQFHSNYEKFVGNVRRDIRKMKRWTGIERFVIFITFAALFVATLNYFRGFVADINSATKEVKALVTTSNINAYGGRISSLETNSVQALNDFRNQIASIASSSSAMMSNIANLDERLKRLETQLPQNKQGSANTNSSSK